MKFKYYVLSAVFSSCLLMGFEGFANQNTFNPDISLILNGKYQYDNKILANDGGNFYNSSFLIDESELTISSSIDDKFNGALTLAVMDGEIGVEEAFINSSLYGVNVKVGRSLWDIGYLNSKHPHSDNFATRPIAYEFFMGESFNGDGGQFSYVLPVKKYVEVGVGVYNIDYNSDYNNISYSTYLRFGEDIGKNQDYRIGLYLLANRTDTKNIIDMEDSSNNLFIMDYKYNINFMNDAKLTFIGEYYHNNLAGVNDDIENYSADSGYYASLVYQFNRRWAVGGTYSQIFSKNEDYEKYQIQESLLMVSYNNSEFSTIRLQYGFAHNNDSLDNYNNHTVILHYVVSIGAHSAHSY